MKDQQYLKIERDLMERSLDEWIFETGVITPNASYHGEVAAIVRMAFDKGAETQLSLMQSRLESLENALRKANEQAEHFEREWYLRGDVIESLEKDAARYRWLREDCGVVEYKEAFGSIGAGMLPCGDELDSAIDAAMQANKGE